MKTFRKILVLPLVMMLLAGTARSATIVWAGIQDNGLALQGGTQMVAAGSLLRIGIFNFDATLPNDAAIDAALTLGNVALVDSHFTQLDSTTVFGGAGTGYFQRSGNTPQPITPSGLNVAGRQMYIWAFNASTMGAATQYGVFYLPSSADSAWAVPSDDPVTGTNGDGLELSDLTQPNPSTLAANAQIVFGGFSTTPVAGSLRNAANFTLEAPVPEPSSVGLAILGGSALLLWRRRR